MFHTVFRRISSSESLEEDDEDDNEEIDGEDSGEEDDLRRNPRMGSPGMEHLIREEQAANRRLKKMRSSTKLSTLQKSPQNTPVGIVSLLLRITSTHSRTSQN